MPSSVFNGGSRSSRGKGPTTTSIRVYTYRELAEQLEGVGFTELQDFGSLTKEVFTINSERLYLIARKPT